MRAKDRSPVVEASKHLALVPDVVAAGQDVDSQVEQVVGDLRGEPEPAGRVLAIRNHQVDRMVSPELGDQAGDRLTPRTPDDISNGQDGDDHWGIVASGLRSKPFSKTWPRPAWARPSINTGTLVITTCPVRRPSAWTTCGATWKSERPRPPWRWARPPDTRECAGRESPSPASATWPAGVSPTGERPSAAPEAGANRRAPSCTSFWIGSVPSERSSSGTPCRRIHSFPGVRCRTAVRRPRKSARESGRPGAWSISSVRG